MTTTREASSIKRLRGFFHTSLRQNRAIGTDTSGSVFEHLYADPKAQLERDDSLDRLDETMPRGLVAIFWTAFRFGDYPFSRYYLVHTKVWGNIETQELTYVMFEYRFAGFFALRRQPKRRIRSITLTTDYIGTHFEKATELWQEKVDRNWTGEEPQDNTVQVVDTFAPHLRF